MNYISEPASEEFLYRIWNNSSLVSNLFTSIENQSVEILEKGQFNTDAGPDYRNALIKIDGNLQRGDIEIHPVAGDWYLHKHHEDPKYNAVVLHVVTSTCPDSFLTVRNDRQVIPTVNLDDFFATSAEELERTLPVEIKSEKLCGLSALSETEKSNIIEKAGHVRFEQKIQRFNEQCQFASEEQVFYQALLEALGYSKNQIQFRNLAGRLTITRLLDALKTSQNSMKMCESLLFGAAGFLEKESVEQTEYCQELATLWHATPLSQKLDIMKEEDWFFFRLRPQNFPTRRIYGAAVLVNRFMQSGFIEKLVQTVQPADLNVLKIRKELEDLFIVQANEYWSSHFALPNKSRVGSINETIVGKSRAKDIVVNIVLPCLAMYAKNSHDFKMENRVYELYSGYPPLSTNNVVENMLDKVMCDRSALTAKKQQGLIYLQKNRCNGDNCNNCIVD